jgi:hypothetical protein
LPSVTWLASYPKSGNTWVRFMLANYLLGVPVSSMDSLDKEVPDYTRLLSQGRMVPLDNSRQMIVKTHFLPELEVMQSYRRRTGKIVCLVRNPRDVILSSARMLNVADAKKGAFVKDFIAHRGVPHWIKNGWGTWQRSVQEWTTPEGVREYFSGAEVLTLRYEELRADPAVSLRRVVDFLDLGGPVDGCRIDWAVENATQRKMRIIEQLEQASGINAYLDLSHRKPFVGAGLTGQSLATLGADVEAAYRQWLAEDEEFRLCVERFGYVA